MVKMIRCPFFLRRGVEIELTLPVDFNVRELRRLVRYLSTMCDDWEPEMGVAEVVFPGVKRPGAKLMLVRMKETEKAGFQLRDHPELGDRYERELVSIPPLPLRLRPGLVDRDVEITRLEEKVAELETSLSSTVSARDLTIRDLRAEVEKLRGLQCDRAKW